MFYKLQEIFFLIKKKFQKSKKIRVVTGKLKVPTYFWKNLKTYLKNFYMYNTFTVNDE